jgi:hypothetical protein
MKTCGHELCDVCPEESAPDPAQDPEVLALADAIAARMELAIVQRVPRELVELLEDNNNCAVQLPYGLKQPATLLQLKYVRRGDVLELEFWVNATTRAATFRFEST